MDILTTLAMTTLIQGYGDVEDGYPNYNERAVLLYTNAARVDPEAHEEAYNAGECKFKNFTSDEKTAKKPLYWAYPLNQSARYHSQDMLDNNYFSHDSQDGTSAGDRIARWYNESGAGENIAMGYADAWQVMMEGWMCSDGHRANIMTGMWTEIGTGVVNTHYTQNFGAGEVDTWMSIPMGIHDPRAAQSGQNTTFYADYLSPNFGMEGSSLEDGPYGFHAVIDGLAYEMELEWGAAARGVYKTVVQLPGSQECHQYFFIADDASGENRFPEEGSYLVGACDQLEFPDMWIDTQMPIEGREAADLDELKEGLSLVGCSAVDQNPRGWMWAWMIALIGVRRNKR